MEWNNFHRAMLGVKENEKMSFNYIKKKGLSDEELAQCINEGLIRYNKDDEGYYLTSKGLNEVWKKER
ncbi:MAG: hypothetical protein J6J16_08190 [Lachnospiraceae bacterium]|nr:hypothetical protein [Lachnospiraceae bacterium]